MAITIAQNYTQRNYSWTDWKVIFAIKRFLHQYDDDGVMYTVWGYDGPEVHLCQIWKGTIPETVLLNGSITQEQNDLDKTDFEDNYKNNANKSIKKIDSEGRDITVPFPRVGTDIILVSHNFSDPCSWYQRSQRITEETLTSSDGFQWSSDNVNWIDMLSGRMYHDYIYRLEVGHNYDVVVTVDGYAKSYRQPFADSGGDYEIFYEDGYINSFDDWSGKEVLCSYSHATTSEWTLTPPPNKKIDIEVADVQYTSDIVLNDTIVFDTYVYNPYDYPNKFLYETAYFKNMKNLIEEALGQYPLIPKANGPRGTAGETVELPFRYGSVKTLSYSTGVEFTIRLADNRPFIGSKGSFATVSFYGAIGDE